MSLRFNKTYRFASVPLLAWGVFSRLRHMFSLSHSTVESVVLMGKLFLVNCISIYFICALSYCRRTHLASLLISNVSPTQRTIRKLTKEPSRRQ